MKGRVHPAQLANLSQHPTDSKPLLFSLQYFSVFSPSHRDPAAFPIKGKNLRLLHLPTCFLLFTPASLLVLFLGSCIGSYSCISAVKVGKKSPTDHNRALGWYSGWRVLIFIQQRSEQSRAEATQQMIWKTILGKFKSGFCFFFMGVVMHIYDLLLYMWKIISHCSNVD